MKEHRTTSILQRVPVILAVTAASYGLPAQGQAHRPDRAVSMHDTAAGKVEAKSMDRSREEALATQD